MQPRKHAEQAPSVQLLQPSSAVLGLFRAMHAPRHMAHFNYAVMLAALWQWKRLRRYLYLVLGRVLASTVLNLGAPSVLGAGDRSPPSPRTRQSRSSVRTDSSQPETAKRLSYVRLLGSPAQPGPE